MLAKFIRDFKIKRNHDKRVRSIVIRSNDSIVRRLDEMKARLLEAERKEDKEGVIFYKAYHRSLEWLISDEE